MTTLIPLAAYFKRRIHSMRTWPRELLLEWLAWHSVRKHVAYVQDGGGRIIGVGVARPIVCEQAARFRYHAEESSPFVYVEQTAANNQEAFRALLVGLKCRFPSATRILFVRKKSGGKLRSYPFGEFLRKARIA